MMMMMIVMIVTKKTISITITRFDRTLVQLLSQSLSTRKSWFCHSPVGFHQRCTNILKLLYVRIPNILYLLYTQFIAMKQPGYSNFNKRVGLDTNTLGGKPRSLEFSEGEEIVNKEEKVDKKNEKKDEEDGETVVNSVEEEKERRRREATDGNGNRVLQVYRLKIKKTENLFVNSFAQAS